MKTFSTCILIILAFSFISAQNKSLLEILVVPNKGAANPIVQADATGGTMNFQINYTSSCSKKHTIKWSFSKDINSLNNTDKFNVTLECFNCKDQCGKKWTAPSVSGSNNIFFPIQGKYESEYNSNMTGSAVTPGIQPWNDINSATYEISATFGKKQAKYTAFKIVAGPYDIVYVFGDPIQTGTDQVINCHTLLGLGKNLFSLEVGALNNYDIGSWMIPTIDNALTHIAAIGCLSPAYLTGLRSRMLSATNSRDFYGEILEYSQSVETETSTSCAPCGSCSN